jgi:hypothetical protein
VIGNNYLRFVVEKSEPDNGFVPFDAFKDHEFEGANGLSIKQDHFWTCFQLRSG